MASASLLANAYRLHRLHALLLAPIEKGVPAPLIFSEMSRARRPPPRGKKPSCGGHIGSGSQQAGRTCTRNFCGRAGSSVQKEKRVSFCHTEVSGWLFENVVSLPQKINGAAADTRRASRAPRLVVSVAAFQCPPSPRLASSFCVDDYEVAHFYPFLAQVDGDGASTFSSASWRCWKDKILIVGRTDGRYRATGSRRLRDRHQHRSARPIWSITTVPRGRSPCQRPGC